MYNCKHLCIIAFVPCQLVNYPVAVVCAVFSYTVILSCQINCLLVPIFVECAQLEALLVRVSGSEKVWYATNAEIHQYLSAQKMLKISVDERIIYNPTALDLWLEKDKKEKIKIPAGQTVVLP